MPRHFIIRSLFLVCLLSAAGLPAAAALSVSVSNTTVQVSGASANSHIAICGFGQTWVNGVETFTNQASVLKAAPDGSASLAVAQPAFRAVWLVVDLAADVYVVATPPGYSQEPMTQPLFAMRNQPAISIYKQSASLCVVRSPLGAWTGSAVDGASSDADGVLNGRVSVNLRDLTPVGDTPHGPSLFLSRDILFAIDQGWMQCSISRIP